MLNTINKKKIKDKKMKTHGKKESYILIIEIKIRDFSFRHC